MHTITIGRNPECTIVVNDTSKMVSGNHADVHIEDGVLVLTDHSTNGTYINGSLVRNKQFVIMEGDSIMLANSYSVSWSQIAKHFPELNSSLQFGKKTNLMDARGDVGRKTERFDFSAGNTVVPEKQFGVSTERLSQPNVVKNKPKGDDSARKTISIVIAVLTIVVLAPIIGITLLCILGSAMDGNAFALFLASIVSVAIEWGLARLILMLGKFNWDRKVLYNWLVVAGVIAVNVFDIPLLMLLAALLAD